MCYFIVFFKQKTAYEMRISDWSSDVCSSDLDCRHRWSERYARGARGGVSSDHTTDLHCAPDSQQSGLCRLERSQGLGRRLKAHLHRRERRSGPKRANRSEERSVGKECVRTWSYRGAQEHRKKTKQSDNHTQARQKQNQI